MGTLGEYSAFDRSKKPKGAHVIVCGNEKGGSGKTTTTMHVVVFLLKSGFKVATIDLDTRQKSLTRYIHNRRNWAQTNQIDLELPNHFRFDLAQVDSAIEAQSKDFSSFEKAIAEVENSHDFVHVMAQIMEKRNLVDLSIFHQNTNIMI